MNQQVFVLLLKLWLLTIDFVVSCASICVDWFLNGLGLGQRSGEGRALGSDLPIAPSP